MRIGPFRGGGRLWFNGTAKDNEPDHKGRLGLLGKLCFSERTNANSRLKRTHGETAMCRPSRRARDQWRIRHALIHYSAELETAAHGYAEYTANIYCTILKTKGLVPGR